MATNESEGRAENPESVGKSSETTFPRPGTAEWGEMNKRRAELIHKKIAGTLVETERIEYERLQRLSLAALEETFPRTPRD